MLERHLEIRAQGSSLEAEIVGGATTFVTMAQHLTAAEAMSVIVCEGLAITLLVIAGIRERVLDAIPESLRRGIGAGEIARMLLGVAAGRRVHALLWCVAAAFAVYFVST